MPELLLHCLADGTVIHQTITHAPPAPPRPSKDVQQQQHLLFIVRPSIEIIKSALPFFPFLFCFVCLFVLLFSINIYLNICYLIKCINKQQAKYRVSREKIVHRILNIWINNLNFYHLLQFTYCEKSELITT